MRMSRSFALTCDATPTYAEALLALQTTVIGRVVAAALLRLLPRACRTLVRIRARLDDPIRVRVVVAVLLLGVLVGAICGRHGGSRRRGGRARRRRGEEAARRRRQPASSAEAPAAAGEEVPRGDERSSWIPQYRFQI